MAKKISTILIITILSLAAVVAGFFVIKEYFFTNNKGMTDYLPVDTKAYFELQPNNKQLQELYANNFRVKIRLGQMIDQAGLWGDFDSELINDKINKIGLVILEDSNNSNNSNNWKKVWLVEAKDLNELMVLLPKDYLAANLDKKVIVIAQDFATLNIFKKPETMTISTPTQRTIFDKFNQRKFLNSYISKDYLQYVLDQPTDFNKLILNNLNLDPATPAYFSLRADDNQVVFNFQAARLDPRLDSVNPKRTAKRTALDFNNYKNLGSKNYQIVKNLPLQNIFSALAIADLKNIIDNLEIEQQQEIEQIDWKKQKEILAKKYDFKWEDFYDFAANPAILLVKHQTGRLNFNELLQKEDLNYGILVKIDSKKKADDYYLKLKTFLSQYLAWLYPVEQTVFLPDESQITKIAADPQSIKWETINGIEFFANEKIEVALTQKNDIIYLSPDKNLLQEVVLNLKTQLDENEKIEKCPNFSGQEIVYLNTKKLLTGLLSFVDDFLMVIDKDKGGVNLKGCFIW